MQTVFGIKKQQSQAFLDNGTRVPVTVVSIVDNIVLQQKTTDNEGYSAVQIGIGQAKNISKSVTAHAKKGKSEILPKYLREVRLGNDEDVSKVEVGSSLLVSEILAPGDQIKATGTSKGKGFAGGVKRYGFRGGPKTHGQSDRHRAPGSIGQGTTPGRVYKGKRMAGRMGSEVVTVSNLYILDIQGQDVYVSGLVPGSRHSLIRLEKTGEKKNFVPIFRLKEETVEEPKESEEVKEVAEEKKDELAVEPQKTQPVHEGSEAKVASENQSEAVDEEESSTKESVKVEEDVKEEDENGGK